MKSIIESNKLCNFFATQRTKMLIKPGKFVERIHKNLTHLISLRKIFRHISKGRTQHSMSSSKL
jgi:hypothetical protein